MRLFIKIVIVIGAVAIALRFLGLVPSLQMYLTNDPWDWLTLALILSPAAALVYFLFKAQPAQTALGTASPAQQLFMPWWMVDSRSPIAKFLGRSRSLTAQVGLILVFFFGISAVVIIGALLMPQITDFLAAWAFS